MIKKFVPVVFVALAFLAFAVDLGYAQVAPPSRRSAKPTTPVVVPPPPQPTPAATPAAPAPTPPEPTIKPASSVDAAREAYNYAQEVHNSARSTLHAAEAAAEAKAADSTEAKALIAAKAEFDKAEAALNAAGKVVEATNLAAYERGSKVGPGEIELDGGSIVTAEGARVLARDCSSEALPCKDITLYGLLVQLRHQLATSADIDSAYFKTAINIRNGDVRTAGAIDRLRQSGQNALDAHTSWGFIALAALAFMFLTTISVVGGTMITRRFFARARVLGMLLVIGLLGHANLASAQSKTVKVTSVSPDAVGQDYETEANKVDTITMSGNVKADSVWFVTDNGSLVNGITFDIKKVSGRTIQGTLKVDAATAIDDYKVVVGDVDGNTFESDTTILHLFGLEVNRYAYYIQQKTAGQAATIAALRNEVSAIKAGQAKFADKTTTDATIARVVGQMDTTVASVGALDRRVNAVEGQQRATAQQVDAIRKNIKDLIDGQQALSDNQKVLGDAVVELAQTPVKKSFFGGNKPTNLSVAERVKAAIAAANTELANP